MRIYTHWSDGYYTISRTGSTEGVYTDIAPWQWWLYCAYLALDRRVSKWLVALDRRAYDAYDLRHDKQVD